jgi:arylsulfatase A-like enzyme
MAAFVQLLGDESIVRSLARNCRLLNHVIGVFGLTLGATVFAFTPTRITAAEPRHVVVVVWDGMRPDFVSEQNTPALWKLAAAGVNFRNHHSVYPSATEVNGTSIMTGDYPGHTGIFANHVYQAEIDQRKSLDVENSAVVRKGDQVSGGRYICAPTIAELIRKSGRRTVIATSKTVGLLLDRHIDSGGASNCVTFFAGDAVPHDAAAPLVANLGPFPSSHLQQDPWTTKALTEVLWKEEVPAFSLLWLGEPDLTEHETAPGAQAALTAIKSSDDNLARILAALDRRGVRDQTDILVVSDHGFSTIDRAVDLRTILKDAGFDAVTAFVDEPRTGQIMLVGNGGTVLFYVIGHDAGVTRRLVEFLQQSDFAGVIFTRDPMDGTFRFAQARIDHSHAPDVVMAFGWNENKSGLGVPGMIHADWQRAAGKGTHATLSRFDMHNILIAAGPDFRVSAVDDLPTGNVDLAPTILRILGIESSGPMDGRVLSEALVEGERSPMTETSTAEATKNLSSGVWRQTLKISRVGSTIYLDEGNGAFRPSELKPE